MNKAWKITGAIIGIILVVVLLRGCVMTSYLIPSSGMENSLFQGERILVNKWSYGLRLPLMALWNYHRWADSPVQKEDIIVFNNPANLSEPVISRRETFISRCIGVTNSITPRFTSPLTSFGSSSCSQIATRSPALTSFGR